MTLNTSDITVVEGLVNKEFPYYIVYPTTVTVNNYSSYRCVKIYLSKDPITFEDGMAHIEDGRYYEFSRSQYLDFVNGDFSGDFVLPPDSDIFYTSAEYPGAPSLNIDPLNKFEYYKFSALLAMVILVSLVIGRVLVGGK